MSCLPDCFCSLIILKKKFFFFKLRLAYCKLLALYVGLGGGLIFLALQGIQK